MANARKPRSRAQPATLAKPTSPWTWPSELRWAGPAIVALATVCMAWWSWGKHADPLIDFGRELYIPWQLSEGQVLYRDLPYFNGPLAPYLNSLFFRMFGVSLRVLALANLAIVAGLIALLYALLSQIGSRISAALGCLTFVLLFGFSQYTFTSNYNFICPYSYDLTHGIVCSVVALYFLGRLTQSGRWTDAAACGLATGLVLLTKPEVVLACLVAVFAGLALYLWSTRPGARRSANILGAFFCAMLVPPLMAFALLSLAMPPIEAWRGTLGGLRYVFDSALSSMPFYRESMGTQNLAESLGKLGRWTLAYAAIFGLPAAAGLAWRRKGSLQYWVAGLVLVVALLILFGTQKDIAWTEGARPLPVLLLAACGALLFSFLRAKDDAGRTQFIMPIATSLFALAMLAKMILNARLYQYGFGLAMAATLIAIVALWDWAPRLIAHFGGTGVLLRAVTLAVLVVTASNYLRITDRLYEKKTVRVGAGADAIDCDPLLGNDVQRALTNIDSRIPPEGTLAVIPEGITLNYLSRRVNSTGCVNYMPVEMIMFGEEDYLERFQRDPPDFLIWTDEPTAGYGVAAFGDGYAMRLAAWLTERYHSVAAITTNNSPISMVLLERNARRPDSPPAAPDRAKPGSDDPHRSSSIP